MVFDQSVDQELTRAAHRAYARDLAASHVRTAAHGANVSTFFDVQSHSHPGTFHRVRIDATAAGLDITCDCLGSQKGHVCAHAAVALQAWQSLPVDEPAPREPNWLKRQMDDERAYRDAYYRGAR